MKKILLPLFVLILTVVGSSLSLSGTSNAFGHHHGHLSKFFDRPERLAPPVYVPALPVYVPRPVPVPVPVYVPNPDPVYVPRPAPVSPVSVVVRPHYSKFHAFSSETITYTNYWEFVAKHGNCDLTP